MPHHATVTIPARVWTQVTASAVTALRVQNLGPYTVEVQATAAETAPTNDDAGGAGAFELAAGFALAADRPLSDIWPGVTGAARIWVRCAAVAKVSVSHA